MVGVADLFVQGTDKSFVFNEGATATREQDYRGLREVFSGGSFVVQMSWGFV